MSFSVEVTTQAAQLRAQYGLKLPDAAQLATALDMGTAGLVTHERDFSAVKDLPILYGVLGVDKAGLCSAVKTARAVIKICPIPLP